MEVALFVIAITTAVFGVGADYFKIKDSMKKQQVKQEIRDHGGYQGQLPELGKYYHQKQQMQYVYPQQQMQYTNPYVIRESQ